MRAVVVKRRVPLDITCLMKLRGRRQLLADHRATTAFSLVLSRNSPGRRIALQDRTESGCVGKAVQLRVVCIG